MGFISKEVKEKVSSPDPMSLMWYLWDVNLNKRFFKNIKSATNLASQGNYYSAFAAGRLWMKNEGFCPPDHITIFGKLDLLAETAGRKRAEFQEENKNASSVEEGLLRDLYLKVYHNDSLWLRLHQIYARLEKPGAKATTDELTFMNGFLCYVLLATNYMRSGNLSLLESEPTQKALSQSLGEFREKYPEEDIHNSPRRLDRNKMVPAVIRIPKGTKTGKPVDVVLLRPRDIEGLLLYQRFARSKPPCKVTTTKFFFNSKGSCLGVELYFYLRKLRQKLKLKGFTAGNLRRAMEIENGLDNDPSDTSVSDHLGHKISTVKTHYLKKDVRHAVRGANKVMSIFEDIGEEQEKKVSIIIWLDSIMTVSSHPPPLTPPTLTPYLS